MIVKLAHVSVIHHPDRSILGSSVSRSFLLDTALATLGLGAWAAFLLHATNAGMSPSYLIPVEIANQCVLGLCRETLFLGLASDHIPTPEL